MNKFAFLILYFISGLAYGTESDQFINDVRYQLQTNPSADSLVNLLFTQDGNEDEVNKNFQILLNEIKDNDVLSQDFKDTLLLNLIKRLTRKEMGRSILKSIKVMGLYSTFYVIGAVLVGGLEYFQIINFVEGVKYYPSIKTVSLLGIGAFVYFQDKYKSDLKREVALFDNFANRTCKNMLSSGVN